MAALLTFFLKETYAHAKNSHINHKQLWLGILVCFVGTIFYCYEFILRIIPGALQTELSAALVTFQQLLLANICSILFCLLAHANAGGHVNGPIRCRANYLLLLVYVAHGSWMFTMTNSMFLVGCGRFLVGFVSSFAFVGVLSLTLHWLPKRFFSLVAGLITTFGMLGIIYGEVKITQWSLSFGWYHVLMLVAITGSV